MHKFDKDDISKKCFIQLALFVYRKREKELSRTIIQNLKEFKKWAGKQYDAGKSTDEIL